MKVVALARAVPTICSDMILLSVERIFGRIFVEIFLFYLFCRFRNLPGSRTDLLSLPLLSYPTTSPSACSGNLQPWCLIWYHTVGRELLHTSTSRSLSSVRMGCIRLVASGSGSSQAALEAAAFTGRRLVSQVTRGAALPTRRYTATCRH